MAKKRTVVQSTGADELTLAENMAQGASDMDAAALDARAAPTTPKQRLAQAGTMAGYAISSAGVLSMPVGTSANHEWKPAEPTPVDSDPARIPAIPITAARPAWEAEQSANVPGAGDPQNGIVLPATPVTGDPAGPGGPQLQPRYIAWVDVSRDIAQHYPQVEA